MFAVASFIVVTLIPIMMPRGVAIENMKTKAIKAQIDFRVLKPNPRQIAQAHLCPSIATKKATVDPMSAASPVARPSMIE